MSDYDQDCGEYEQQEGAPEMFCDVSELTARRPGKKSKKASRKMLYPEYVEQIRGDGISLRRCVLDDSLRISRDGGLFKRIDDADWDAMLTRHWGLCAGEGRTYNERIYRACCGRLASENPWHPVQEYLESLESWDGKDWIGSLADHIQADAGQDVRRIFEIWLSLAVARAMEPGKHQAICLVLDGPQNIGKSRLVEWLCPDSLREQYTSEAIRPDDKDCKLRAAVKWIWEVGELDATTRKADVSALKQFLTQEPITVRKPYGREDTIKPALSNFVGTVNGEGGYLVDSTGNRRFWPVKISGIDFSYGEIPLDGLWAQALVAFGQGRHLVTRDERRAQTEAGEAAMCEDPVATWAEVRYRKSGDPEAWVSSEEINAALMAEGHRTNPAVCRTIAQTLARMGAVPGRRRSPGKPQIRGYSGIEAAAE